MADKAGLKVLATGRGGVEVVLKEGRPEIAFRGTTGQRVAAWVGVVFMTLMIGGMAWVTIDELIGLRWERVLHPGSTVMGVVAVFYGVIVAMFWAMMLFMVAGFVLAFFPRRVSVVVGTLDVSIRSEQGPSRRERRVPRSAVRRLLVRPPFVSTTEKLGRPLAEQSAIILVEDVNGRRRLVPGRYPQPLAARAAREVAAAVDRAGRGVLPRATHAVEAVDVVGRGGLNADATEVPDIVVERDVEGVRMAVRREGPTLGRLMRTPMFRSGLWVIVLLAGAWVSWPWLVPPGDPAAAAIRSKVGLIFGGYALLGAMMSAAVAYAMMRREELRVTPDHLERQRRVWGWRRVRRWSRGDVAAVTAGYRLGDNGRVNAVLELRTVDGKPERLTGGDAVILRQLGSALRRELAVPADIADPATHAGLPTDPAWHRSDRADPPAKCPFVVMPTTEGVTVQKPAAGWTVSAVGCVIMSGIFLLAAVTIPAVVAMWTPPEEDAMRTAVVLAVMCGGFGAVGTWFAVAEATGQWNIEAAAGRGLIARRRSAWGQRRRAWTGELAAIRTRSVFERNPKSGVWVVAVTVTGAEQKVVPSGEAEVMRYLATVLRRALGVRADADQPASAPATESTVTDPDPPPYPPPPAGSSPTAW